MGNFRGHLGAVLSVFWHHANGIYSGGDDYILRRWDRESCPVANPPTKSLRPPTKNAKKSKNPQKSQQKQRNKNPQIENRETEGKTERKDADSVCSEETGGAKFNRKKKFGQLSQRDHNAPVDDVILLQRYATKPPEKEVESHLEIYLEGREESITRQVAKEMKNATANDQTTTAGLELSAWLATYAHFLENGQIRTVAHA